MKKATALLAAALAVVTGCMIYLVVHGVVLRSAPLIKPTILDSDLQNAAHDVVLRLYPDFAAVDFVLLGMDPASDESGEFLRRLQIEGEKILRIPVRMLIVDAGTTAADLESCPKPCWVILPKVEAHELRPNPWIEGNLKPLGRTYMSISWVPFEREVKVTAACDHEQRLDLECLVTTGVREVSRKMKDPRARYYFMRKYNDHDHFLFVERADLTARP